jgi:plastocyanin
MTGKNTSVAAIIAAMPLIVLALLMSNPTKARSEAKLQTAEVRVDNFTFGPQSLTVPLNTTVTWVNRDDIPHVIVSDDGVFRSKALDTDDKYSFTFTKAGTYPYFCGIHPKMVGKIVVQ